MTVTDCLRGCMLALGGVQLKTRSATLHCPLRSHHLSWSAAGAGHLPCGPCDEVVKPNVGCVWRALQGRHNDLPHRRVAPCLHRGVCHRLELAVGVTRLGPVHGVLHQRARKAGQLPGWLLLLLLPLILCLLASLCLLLLRAACGSLAGWLPAPLPPALLLPATCSGSILTCR